MMKKPINFLAMVTIFSLLFSACVTESQNKESAETHDDTLHIYTTLFPLQDFTKKIGSEHVNVANILPPGSDAHTYEPTSKTMIDIAKADAFIFSGYGSAAYTTSIVKSLQNEPVKMVDVSKGTEQFSHDKVGHESDSHHGEEEAEDHEHTHGDNDPHIWLDPNRAIIIAENIKDSLIELKPEAQEDFKQNFENLKAKFQDLDDDFHQMVQSKDDPKMLVSHAAYGYWEEVYGIEQLAIAGLSPTNEPSQKQLENIIEKARSNDIKYVIFEQNITPKIAQVIQNELNSEALRLHNLAVLTEEDIKNGEDYFSLMQKNIDTLDKALQ